jgi:hypothetical protein
MSLIIKYRVPTYQLVQTFRYLIYEERLQNEYKTTVIIEAVF